MPIIYVLKRGHQMVDMHEVSIDVLKSTDLSFYKFIQIEVHDMTDAAFNVVGRMSIAPNGLAYEITEYWQHASCDNNDIVDMMFGVLDMMQNKNCDL